MSQFVYNVTSLGFADNRMYGPGDKIVSTKALPKASWYTLVEEKSEPAKDDAPIRPKKNKAK